MGRWFDFYIPPFPEGGITCTAKEEGLHIEATDYDGNKISLIPRYRSKEKKLNALDVLTDKLRQAKLHAENHSLTGEPDMVKECLACCEFISRKLRSVE